MGEEHIGNRHLFFFWLGTFRFFVSAIDSFDRSGEGMRGSTVDLEMCNMSFKILDLLLFGIVQCPSTSARHKSALGLESDHFFPCLFA